MLSPTETWQVVQILTNLHTKNKRIPYYNELEIHPVFWQFFKDLDTDQKSEVREIIQWYIKTTIQNGKTKWAEFFRRFYHLHTIDFRLFRDLNSDWENIKTKDFQEIWESLQQELFKFENMLTRNMWKRWYWLDKVVSSFYDIVHSYFPRFSSIK